MEEDRAPSVVCSQLHFLHIYNVTGPCAKIGTSAGEKKKKSKWLLQVPRVRSSACSFLLCDRGPNLNSLCHRGVQLTT